MLQALQFGTISVIVMNVKRSFSVFYIVKYCNGDYCTFLLFSFYDLEGSHNFAGI